MIAACGCRGCRATTLAEFPEAWIRLLSNAGSHVLVTAGTTLKPETEVAKHKSASCTQSWPMVGRERKTPGVRSLCWIPDYWVSPVKVPQTQYCRKAALQVPYTFSPSSRAFYSTMPRYDSWVGEKFGTKGNRRDQSLLLFGTHHPTQSSSCSWSLFTSCS